MRHYIKNLAPIIGLIALGAAFAGVVYAQHNSAPEVARLSAEAAMK